MSFVRYTLWFIASFALLAFWNAVGIGVIELADTVFVHTPGPNTTSLWFAYSGMVFNAFVWPAILLTVSYEKAPLGRMLRGWVLALALMNLVFGIGLILSVISDGLQLTMFGRDLSTGGDALLGAALYAGSVIAARQISKWRASKRSAVVVVESV